MLAGAMDFIERCMEFYRQQKSYCSTLKSGYGKEKH